METEIFEYKGSKFKIRPGTLDEFVVKEVYASYKQLELCEDDVVVDAGANIGVFAVMAASLGAYVISYEPEPENFELLLQNVELNGLQDRVEAHQAALHPIAGKLNLSVNVKRNKGTHSVFARRGRDTVEVVCHEWRDLPPFNKIKVDIEGAEYLLIEECLDAIASVDTMVMEMHINGFGVERYHKAIEKLKEAFGSRLVYKEDPKKAWTAMLYVKGRADVQKGTPDASLAENQ